MANRQLPVLPQWAIDLQTQASTVVNEHGVERSSLEGGRPVSRSFSGVIELLNAPESVLLKEETLFHIHVDDLELATRSLEIHQALGTSDAIMPVMLNYSVVLEPIDPHAAGEDRVEMEFNLNGVMDKGYQVNRRVFPHNGRIESRTFSVKEARKKGLLMKDLLPYIVETIVREQTRLEEDAQDFVMGGLLSLPPRDS